MKKMMLVLAAVMLLGILPAHSAFAAAADNKVSGYGNDSILKTQSLTYWFSPAPNISDGNDNTTYEIMSNNAANNIRGDFTKTPEYIAEIFVRTRNSKDGANLRVQLTFVDDTTETVVASSTSVMTSYYLPVANNTKRVKSLLAFTDLVGGSYQYNYVAEMDLLRNTNTVPPAAPLNVKAEASSGKVLLTWSAGTSASSYEVYQDGKQLTSITGTQHTITGLSNNRLYKWQVKSLNVFGSSPLSAEVTSYYDSAPGTPRLLTATAGPGAGRVVVTWEAAKNASSYNVYLGSIQHFDENIL